MLRFALLLVLGTIFSCKPAEAQDQKPRKNLPPVQASPSLEILGEQTNGLQPDIFVSRARTNWYVEIDMLCHSNFPTYTWLKPTNRVASKLEVWFTNGVAVVSHSPDVLAAARLPEKTTVASIMQGVERNRRGLQWALSIMGESRAGEAFPVASFGLRPAFDIPLTNDVLLQITPVLYRVDTDKVTAHLVTFNPVRIKLLSSGTGKGVNP
jgi:hypothetical protein